MASPLQNLLGLVKRGEMEQARLLIPQLTQEQQNIVEARFTQLGQYSASSLSTLIERDLRSPTLAERTLSISLILSRVTDYLSPKDTLSLERAAPNRHSAVAEKVDLLSKGPTLSVLTLLSEFQSRLISPKSVEMVARLAQAIRQNEELPSFIYPLALPEVFWRNASHLHEVTSLDFTGCSQLNAAEIEKLLRACPNVTSITLDHCFWVQFNQVATQPRPLLKELSIVDCHLQSIDEVSALLRNCPNLESIRVGGKTYMFFEDSDAFQQPDPENPFNINFNVSSLFDPEPVLATIGQLCPNLKTCEIAQTALLTVAKIQRLGAACQNLENLYLNSSMWGLEENQEIDLIRLVSTFPRLNKFYILNSPIRIPPESTLSLHRAFRNLRFANMMRKPEYAYMGPYNIADIDTVIDQFSQPELWPIIEEFVQR